MDDAVRLDRGSFDRALAGDGAALAAVRQRLEERLARSDDTEAGERTRLLRGAYAAALDLLPRLVR